MAVEVDWSRWHGRQLRQNQARSLLHDQQHPPVHVRYVFTIAFLTSLFFCCSVHFCLVPGRQYRGVHPLPRHSWHNLPFFPFSILPLPFLRVMSPQEKFFLNLMRWFFLKPQKRSVLSLAPNFFIFCPLEDFRDAFCVAGLPLDAAGQSCVVLIANTHYQLLQATDGAYPLPLHPIHPSLSRLQQTSSPRHHAYCPYQSFHSRLKTHLSNSASLSLSLLMTGVIIFRL